MPNTYTLCQCGNKMRSIAKECRSCWKLKLSDRRKGELNNRFGKKLTDVQKKNISESNKKIALEKGSWGFQKEYKPWNKGKYGLTHWKPERREKIMAYFKKERYKGNGDRRLWGKRKFKDIQWSKKVKTRDGFVCRVCLIDKKLQTHHIKKWDEYPKLRYIVSNGITLCEKHHFSIAYKEKLFEDFFIKILNNKPKNMLEEFQTLLSKIQAGKYAAKRGIPLMDNSVLNLPGMEVNA